MMTMVVVVAVVMSHSIVADDGGSDGDGDGGCDR